MFCCTTCSTLAPLTHILFGTKRKELALPPSYYKESFPKSQNLNAGIWHFTQEASPLSPYPTPPPAWGQVALWRDPVGM